MVLIKVVVNEYSPCMSVHFTRSWGVTFVSGFTQLLEIYNYKYIDNKCIHANFFCGNNCSKIVACEYSLFPFTDILITIAENTNHRYFL